MRRGAYCSTCQGRGEIQRRPKKNKPGLTDICPRCAELAEVDFLAKHPAGYPISGKANAAADGEGPDCNKPIPFPATARRPLGLDTESPSTVESPRQDRVAAYA